ncbi:MAG: patatin-like phospholipase family protein [Kiritimatiellia bacterium]
MSALNKIGLALGSGGARGWAHIGALLELQKLGIGIDYIAGTSIGSIAGALYGTDTLALAVDLALNLNWKDVARLFLEVNFQRSGLVSGKNFVKLLKDIIPARTFGQLSLPLAVVVTDLKAEREVVFNRGDLFHAIRASIGIPGVFTPVPDANRHLVDGGLVNPLPISVCRAMGADQVIAIDVNLCLPDPKRSPFETKSQITEAASDSTRLTYLKNSVAKLLPQLSTPISETLEHWFDTDKKERESLSILDVLTLSFRLTENELTRNTLKLHPPEILIQPAVGHIMTLEFYRGPEAIAAGQAAVLAKREELLALRA